MIKAKTVCLTVISLLAWSTAAFPGVSVRISGIDGDLKDKLADAVTLAHQKEQEHLLTSARIKALFSRSRGEITAVLQSNGYYRFTIDDRLEQNGDDWTAYYDIEPGIAIRIDNISVKIVGAGQTDTGLTGTLADFPLKKGDRLDHTLYESGKRRMQNIARERGYFDAGFTRHAIYINESENTAEIALTFDTGERYRFGEIIIPETVVGRDRLESLIPFQSGDPYDANLLITLIQRFRDSNYFSDVQVTPDHDNIRDNLVPVAVNLTPRARNSYRAGLGFGTDSGPRLTAAWDNYYVNRAGHRAGANLRLSPTNSALSASYILPDFPRRGSEAGFVSSLAREDTDTSTSNIFTIGARHTQSRRGWNEIISLSYQYENFKVGGIERNGNLLIPAITYRKTVSDDPVYTRNGFRLSLDLRGSLSGLVSDVTFLQTTFRGKYIRAIGGRGRFITRADVGATFAPDFIDLPASLRFFAGGDNSIRGFDLEAVGARNAEGRVTGGKFLTVGSLEYEHRIFGNWSGAVFTDFGSAFDKFSDNFVYSTGAGIRWRTPIGLIRLDLAIGISEDGNPLRLHFNVGPDL